MEEDEWDVEAEIAKELAALDTPRSEDDSASPGACGHKSASPEEDVITQDVIPHLESHNFEALRSAWAKREAKLQEFENSLAFLPKTIKAYNLQSNIPLISTDESQIYGTEFSIDKGKKPSRSRNDHHDNSGLLCLSKSDCMETPPEPPSNLSSFPPQIGVLFSNGKKSDILESVKENLQDWRKGYIGSSAEALRFQQLLEYQQEEELRTEVREKERAKRDREVKETIRAAQQREEEAKNELRAKELAAAEALERQRQQVLESLEKAKREEADRLASEQEEARAKMVQRQVAEAAAATAEKKRLSERQERLRALQKQAEERARQNWAAGVIVRKLRKIQGERQRRACVRLQATVRGFLCRKWCKEALRVSLLARISSAEEKGHLAALERLVLTAKLADCSRDAELALERVKSKVEKAQEALMQAGRGGNYVEYQKARAWAEAAGVSSLHISSSLKLFQHRVSSTLSNLQSTLVNPLPTPDVLKLATLANSLNCDPSLVAKAVAHATDRDKRLTNQLQVVAERGDVRELSSLVNEATGLGLAEQAEEAQEVIENRKDKLKSDISRVVEFGFGDYRELEKLIREAEALGLEDLLNETRSKWKDLERTALGTLYRAAESGTRSDLRQALSAVARFSLREAQVRAGAVMKRRVQSLRSRLGQVATCGSRAEVVSFCQEAVRLGLVREVNEAKGGLEKRLCEVLEKVRDLKGNELEEDLVLEAERLGTSRDSLRMMVEAVRQQEALKDRCSDCNRQKDVILQSLEHQPKGLLLEIVTRNSISVTSSKQVQWHSIWPVPLDYSAIENCHRNWQLSAQIPPPPPLKGTESDSSSETELENENDDSASRNFSPRRRVLSDRGGNRVLTRGLLEQILGGASLLGVQKLDLALEGLSELSRDGELAKWCPDLKSLRLDVNCFSRLHPGFEHLSLLSLSVKDNLLTSLSSLSSLSSLQILRLDSNRLVSIPEPSRPWWPSLQELGLGSNRLASLGRLGRLCPSLEVLEAGSNRLRTLTGSLEGLHKLRSLDVGRNRLKGRSLWAPLQHCPLLILVVAARNKVKEIATPQDLPGAVLLRELWLNGNAITKLECSSWMPSLQRLYLQDNAVEEIGSLWGCPNLEVLDLSFNCLGAVEQLEPLSSLRHLRSLQLNDNPVALLGGVYTSAVLRTLPWLQELDNEPVTEPARFQALKAVLNWGASSYLVPLMRLSLEPTLLENPEPLEVSKPWELGVKQLQKLCVGLGGLFAFSRGGVGRLQSWQCSTLERGCLQWRQALRVRPLGTLGLDSRGGDEGGANLAACLAWHRGFEASELQGVYRECEKFRAREEEVRLRRIVLIQTVWRARKARQKAREVRGEVRRKAVRRIQAWWQGCCARKKVQAMHAAARCPSATARCPSAAARGPCAAAARCTAQEARAAAKIQATWRGARLRAHIERARLAARYADRDSDDDFDYDAVVDLADLSMASTPRNPPPGEGGGGLSPLPVAKAELKKAGRGESLTLSLPPIGSALVHPEEETARSSDEGGSEAADEDRETRYEAKRRKSMADIAQEWGFKDERTAEAAFRSRQRLLKQARTSQQKQQRQDPERRMQLFRANAKPPQIKTPQAPPANSSESKRVSLLRPNSSSVLQQPPQQKVAPRGRSISEPGAATSEIKEFETAAPNTKLLRKSMDARQSANEPPLRLINNYVQRPSSLRARLKDSLK